MGRIGTAVAMRAKAFGLDVQYYDPYVPSGTDKALNVRCMELDELLRTSDIVSVHTPLTEETRGMLNKNKLSQMKESSILINTARGEVIPLDDLYWALKNDVIKATGVDVLETEPAPLDHPLVASWKANDPWIRGRLCITPHAAFFTDESFDELKHKGWLTVKDFFEKSKIKNCVNIRSSYGA
jgi:lactate dehydrogenase-like 2-hydroxyacid dehydrogenase